MGSRNLFKNHVEMDRSIDPVTGFSSRPMFDYQPNRAELCGPHDTDLNDILNLVENNDENQKNVFDIKMDNISDNHCNEMHLTFDNLSDTNSLSNSFDVEKNYFDLANSVKPKIDRGISLFEDHLNQLLATNNDYAVLKHSKSRFESYIEDSLLLQDLVVQPLNSEELTPTDVSIIQIDRHKRDKNNESSRKCREAKKRKFDQMNVDSSNLELENSKLRKATKMFNSQIKFLHKCIHHPTNKCQKL